jgi:hypothetical protein
VESLPLVKPASRLTLWLFVPWEKTDTGEVDEATPEVRVHDDDVLAPPWAAYWAATEAEAGPAGSQARAAARPAEAVRAMERRNDLRVNMRQLPVGCV